jgi:hypothetical protein
MQLLLCEQMFACPLAGPLAQLLRSSYICLGGHPFLGGCAQVAQKKYQQKFASTVNFPQLKK